MCIINMLVTQISILQNDLHYYTQSFFFNFVDRFHGSVLHGDRCTAGCEAHRNFADESAWLLAHNVWNEGT
jgi:hypothetical protein